MGRKKEISGIQIGMSFMVLIFVVLCLTVFSILSLMSAMSDARLAEKTLKATEEYYKADSIAEGKLREVDRILSDSANMNQLGGFYDSTTNLVYYEIPINEKQMLCVELEVISSAKPGEKRYNILRWQEVNNGEYEIDDSLPVWTGEESL